MTAPMVDYKIHWLKMMSVPESRAVVGRHDGINGRDRLAGLYGSTAAGAARGLALRMDHGSQYLSDHFTNQIKFWGIQPSYAFVAEPQTNGVAERFNRTLKEQIIHGRIYRNIAELRDAVRDFVELYNAQWIVEKNGYLSPAQARQAWHAAISIRPAA